ncbi:TIGR04197 family type VII secretion effector [Pseudogracilibacillus sp. SO30301A]|uniref:TIGR04197 family type VII secretion effector n=1 Tax=Pseudogracilibacillus sp. SO30301A TaxID=3098291 RepID=UPI003FA7496C
MIQSSLKTAEDIASEMGNASDAIQTAVSKTIPNAEKTTLAVNAKAQEANQEAIKLARLFNQCFQETIENIHKVAKEFERTDQEMGAAINRLLPINEALRDLNTYQKAKNG